MYKRTRHFFEREYSIDYQAKKINIDESKHWYLSLSDFVFSWIYSMMYYGTFFFLLFYACKVFLHINLFIRFDLFLWILGIFFFMWQICYCYLPYKFLAKFNMALEFVPWGFLTQKRKFSIGINSNKLILIKLRNYWKYRLKFAGSCAESISSISYKKINFLSKRLIIIKFIKPASGVVNFEYKATEPISKVWLF